MLIKEMYTSSEFTRLKKEFDVEPGGHYVTDYKWKLWYKGEMYEVNTDDGLFLLMKYFKCKDEENMINKKETVKQQMKDSDMIFNQITSGDFKDYNEAQQALVMFYVPDMTISRSGISHAMKRLEDYYRTK